MTEYSLILTTSKHDTDNVDDTTVAGCIAESLARIFLFTHNEATRQKAYEKMRATSNLDFAKNIRDKLNEYLEYSKLNHRKQKKRKRSIKKQEEFSDDEKAEFSETDEKNEFSDIEEENQEFFSQITKQEEFSDDEKAEFSEADEKNEFSDIDEENQEFSQNNLF
uniref:Uncharacterized protein n=1 Tax=Acrobeloides nanus TaxID=290746 RepID=A0A914CKC5_9BILA